MCSVNMSAKVGIMVESSKKLKKPVFFGFVTVDCNSTSHVGIDLPRWSSY